MSKNLQIRTLFLSFGSILKGMHNRFKIGVTRRSMYSFVGVLLIGVSLAACNGSRGLAKKGAQLQQAGLYSDAADFFYSALLKNNKNVDARIGLTSAGQQVLNAKLSEFSSAKAIGDDKKAVYSYLDAVAFREKVQRLGIS